MNMKIAIKNTLCFTVLILIGVISIVFSVLYIEECGTGFLFENRKALEICVVVIFTALTAVSMTLALTDKNLIYKITVITLALLSVSLTALYLMKITGFWDRIDSVEDLREYVLSFGASAVIIYTVLNFLQVVILPIPGVVSIGAGVAMFGPLLASFTSLIGIFLGSIVAFYIGRLLGYKVVCWLVGEDTINKWLKAVKNKDKIVLTFMFLFPFFPDDVLCFVAGLSTMSSKYFIIMIAVCRIISVFSTAYSLNGSIIPYTTWWGIVIWSIIIVITILISIYIYKYGDRIESYFKNKFARKK